MRVEIKVNTGMFRNIHEANSAQNEINWWDEKDTRAKFCTESFLALDLSSELSKVASSVTVNTDDDSYDTLIIIGRDAISEYAPDDETGFLKSTVRNGKRVVELYGHRREGTINAVYEFLSYLGFRYYNTDAYSEIAPKQLIIEEFEYQTNPDFVTRGCYNEFTDDSNFDFIKWMTRNRMNMLKVKVYHNPYELKKRGIRLLSGGHEIFYNYLNPNKPFPYSDRNETYFDAHPEWFALIDGKRSNRDENKKAKEGYYTGDNICTSNVDGLKELSKNVIASLIDGELRYCDLLNFWAYDNGTWCDCDACKASGNYATRMLMSAYHLHREIKNAYQQKILGRNVKIIIPIYHETLTPPTNDLPDDFDYENIIITFFPIERCYVHYINDPKCTESNIHLKKLYEMWAVDTKRKYKGEVFVGEYFNVSSFASLPFVFTDKIIHDLKYYHENNTRHFYYMHISTIEWGMLTLNNYLIARMMWDVNCSADDILNQYYEDIYPSSRELLEKFHHTLELASQNSKYLKHYQFEEQGINKPSLMWGMFEGNLFPLKHCQFDHREDDDNAGISFVETMKLFDKANEQIETIEKKCSEYEKTAVSIEKMRFDYGYLIMRFLYHLVKLRIAHQNDNKTLMTEELKITESYRKILEGIKRPIEDDKYECTPWLNDAFNATWVASRYMDYIEVVKKLIF